MPVKIAVHALIRYFERIEDVRMSEVRRRMRDAGVPDGEIRSDKHTLDWMEANGYGVAAVRVLFDQPMVEHAIAAGITRVKIETNCWLHLKNGIVASVLTEEQVRTALRPSQKPRRPYYPGKRRPGWRK